MSSASLATACIRTFAGATTIAPELGELILTEGGALRIHVRDVAHGSQIAPRASIIQRKTQHPVQFEITQQTRDALTIWIESRHLQPDDYLFPSRQHDWPHLSTRQYARIVKGWVRCIGLDEVNYGNLLRDGVHTCWSSADGEAFLNAVTRLWNEW